MQLPLFPTAASTISSSVDWLYFYLVAVSAVMSLLIFGAVFFFAIIGVFGFTAAIGALALFLVLALLTFRRPRAEGTQR